MGDTQPHKCPLEQFRRLKNADITTRLLCIDKLKSSLTPELSPHIALAVLSALSLWVRALLDFGRRRDLSSFTIQLMRRAGTMELFESCPVTVAELNEKFSLVMDRSGEVRAAMLAHLLSRVLGGGGAGCTKWRLSAVEELLRDLPRVSKLNFVL